MELYRRNVDGFLQWLQQEEVTPERFASLSATRAREYLQSEAPRFGRSARKNLVITLRSFLRYAFMAGHVSRDVASTLERVPCFTLDRLPRGPKWEDIPKLVETADRATAAGRRDFAMLLLLITYGIRASQLTALRVDDLRWREGEIVIPPAKRGRTVVVPITASVGTRSWTTSVTGGLSQQLARSSSRWIRRSIHCCPAVCTTSSRGRFNCRA